MTKRSRAKNRSLTHKVIMKIERYLVSMVTGKCRRGQPQHKMGAQGAKEKEEVLEMGGGVKGTDGVNRRKPNVGGGGGKWVR